MSTSALSTQDEKIKSLGLQRMTVNKEQVASYSRALGTASDQNPVLVLVHGYPQSSYMWRHLIPLLPASAPIFAPDLPGYGASAPIEKNDKLTVGSTVLAALLTEAKRTSSKPLEPLPIVLIGHDRGARVVHHLAVEGFAGVDIKGVCMIDIVPTTVQWQSSATQPAAVVSYFHWPLLANVSLATRLITAFGPEAWCEEMLTRWAGADPTGLSSLKADDSFAVYKAFFAQPHTLEASNRDYEAGAGADVEKEAGWLKEGKKIDVKTLVVFSEKYLGGRFDVEGVWGEWVEDGKLESHALGGGVGHFGAEEAPRETANAILKWLKGL